MHLHFTPHTLLLLPRPLHYHLITIPLIHCTPPTNHYIYLTNTTNTTPTQVCLLALIPVLTYPLRERCLLALLDPEALLVSVLYRKCL